MGEGDDATSTILYSKVIIYALLPFILTFVSFAVWAII